MDDDPTPRRPAWQGMAAGAIGAVAGLAPWLATGARLPLQNLWASTVLPDAMPFALLPVSQYDVLTVLALLATGAVAAAIAAAWLRLPRWATAVGLAVVHVVALAQAFSVAAEGLEVGSTADSRVVLYFGAMLAAAVMSAVLAQIAFRLVTSPSAATRAVGIALVALPVSSWCALWMRVAFGPGSIPGGLLAVMPWIPAVLIGVALGWCGFRPAPRVVVWAVALALLWVLPALTTAFASATGMRVLGDDVAEMADYGLAVFPLALLRVPAWPVLGALLIGLVVWATRVVLRTRAAERNPLPATARRP
ncbi:hypothetical protein [Microbacterium gilvum]|uniref:Integral membrane protein n=1 Tax=Microbacterium gilvum TaxID=1336204 RepID=A0ABP8ZTF4_9MICO